MKPTLLFTAGHDPFSGAIRQATWAPCSHSAIGLGDTLLHTTERGVVTDNRDEYFKTSPLVAEYEIIPDVADRLPGIIALMGQKYDYGWVAGWLIKGALDVQFSPLAACVPLSRAGMTCAQLVFQLDPRGERIPEWRGLDVRDVTPAQLWRRTHGPSFRPVARIPALLPSSARTPGTLPP